MSAPTLVLREDVGRVAILTLNRPGKLNALSPELFAELRAHIDALAGEQTRVGCVLLRGAGRAFCAGADVEALKRGHVTADPEMRSTTIERFGLLPQATIAAVHGHCMTGGIELALAADFIIAAEDTRFRDTHALLGILPRWGLSARLPRRIGLVAAKRMSLTSASLDAREALRIGLCDEVAASSDLTAVALQRANALAALPASVVVGIKHLYAHAGTLPLHEALAYERAYSTTPPARV